MECVYCPIGSNILLLGTSVLDSIRKCFTSDNVVYAKHARQEMLGEEYVGLTEGGDDEVCNLQELRC